MDHGPQGRAAGGSGGIEGERNTGRRPPAAPAGRRAPGGEAMIVVKRGTLVVMLVIAAALGVGLGSWGASAVDLARPPAHEPTPARDTPPPSPCPRAASPGLRRP